MTVSVDIKLILETAAAAAAMIAACLWWLSAAKKAPARLYDGGRSTQTFVATVGSLNKWAAFFTGLSAISTALAEVCDFRY
jgi:hypothetical protein